MGGKESARTVTRTVLINIVTSSHTPIISIPTTSYRSIVSGPDDSYNRGIVAVGRSNDVGQWKTIRIDQQSRLSVYCPVVTYHREWMEHNTVSNLKLNGLGIANGCSYSRFVPYHTFFRSFHCSSTTNDIVSSEIQNSEGNVKDPPTLLKNSSNNNDRSHSKPVQIENLLETHTKRLYFYLENKWNDSDKNDEWLAALCDTMTFMSKVLRLNIMEQNALWKVFLEVFVPEIKVRFGKSKFYRDRARDIFHLLLSKRRALYKHFHLWYGRDFFDMHKEMVWLDHCKLWNIFIELGDIPSNSSFVSFLVTGVINPLDGTPRIHNVCDILTYISQSKCRDHYPSDQMINAAIQIVVEGYVSRRKSKQHCEEDAQQIFDCMIQSNIELDNRIFKSVFRLFLKLGNFHKISQLVSEDEIFCLSDFECCSYLLTACKESPDSFDYEYTHKCIQINMKNYIECLQNHQKNGKSKLSRFKEKYPPLNFSGFLEVALIYYQRMKNIEHYDELVRQIEYSKKLLKNIQKMKEKRSHGTAICK